MTEAYVLAGELLRAKGDLGQAFGAYEARLRRFVDGKQSSAGQFVSVFAARTWPRIWLRNLGMCAMNFHPVGDLLFVGRSLRDTFVLPDYEM
jgi:2-polyprenyl-6-methoxyphenol hydroxylase-like FAD-dependent oxidoreductase